MRQSDGTLYTGAVKTDGVSGDDFSLIVSHCEWCCSEMSCGKDRADETGRLYKPCE